MPHISQTKQSHHKFKSAVILLVVFSFLMVHFSPTSSLTVYANDEIKSQCDGKKLIALTFDDGPSGNIPQLLELLKEYSAKATFFVLGNKAEACPELIKDIQNDGHLIGNHTYSHERMWFTTPKTFDASIAKTNEIIENITGSAPEFYRPPHGSLITFTVKTVPMICINWSLDTIDWKYQDAKNLADKLVAKAKDGAIVLMHDRIDSTIEGLKVALPILADEGYTFVTVKDILQRNGNSIKSGVTYFYSPDYMSGIKM